MVSPLEEFGSWEKLKVESEFIRIIAGHYRSEAQKVYLKLGLSRDRLKDAHAILLADIDRVTKGEFGEGQLDQFKLAGFLCFWLRRVAPIIHITRDYPHGASAGNDVLQALEDEQNFFMKHANEYLAFDAGFRLCRSFELWRKLKDEADKRKYPVINGKFLTDVLAVLKVKNVSTHSLYLVYHALFEGIVR
jgi:hypothetical protein